VVMSRRRRWSLLAAVSSALLLIALDNSVLYTALPTLTRELGADGSASLWIVNAYPVVMAGLLLGAGTLGDRVGHVRMFHTGLVIFGAASLVATFAPTAGVLIAARALLAVGAATMMPATLALIRVTFHVERERNIAIAVWGTVSIVGAALGPIVGGVLLQAFWWGAVFLINVPIVVAALTATALIRPSNDPDPAKRWDLTSSIQAMTGLIAMVVAIKEFADPGPAWSLIAVAVMVSAVALTLFARRQRRLPHPLLDFTIFTNKAFTAGVIAAAVTMFAIGGVQLVTVQRLQLVVQFSPIESGLVVSAIMLGSVPTALLGGVILHRSGLRLLISGGLALAGLGLTLSVMTFAASLLALVTGLVISGLGLGAVIAVASTAIVGNARSRQAGMAASIEEVSWEFGNLTAVAVIGTLIGLVYSATIRLPPSAPDAARDSLTTALALPEGTPELHEAAHAAFDTGYLVVMIVITATVFAGALLTRRLLRHHGPGTPSSIQDD